MFSKVFTALCLVLSCSIAGSFTAQAAGQQEFYNAISSDKEAVVDARLAEVRKAGGADKEAYEGALLMTKAQWGKKPKDKLSLFKEGRAKLEAAIQKNAENTEYRFLRLIIQENAPNVVKYKENIDADAAIVKANYKKLPPELQQVIASYSKKSKVLKPGDF